MKILTIIDSLQSICLNGVVVTTCQVDASWTSVAITAIICATILIIAFVWIIKHFHWKAKERQVQHEESMAKRELEEEVHRNRQKTDLLDKLLKSMESRTKKENAAKLDEQACKDFEDWLNKKLIEAEGKCVNNQQDETKA